MDFTQWAQSTMLMDENAWARHANPKSVYSRFSILPLLSLAIWSREWIGWYCVIAIALCLLWTWLNPRLFGPPKTTNNWASMGTFGERIFLATDKKDLPTHHQHVCLLLQLFTAIGVPILFYGWVTLNIWAVVLGNLWVMLFKAWFVDRMVWLYLDLKDTQPEYASWLKRG
ncbi:DUF6653 family protein [Neptunicella marina]|uniref:Uncharacterized protein n=1 Tax=Neptunicella marina TaxID=2125989 RepID=A0A8J6IX00_9ALTE|nr:DUF6653 family protein [Neptunicella marina]MBC3767100.1 hypothetical protein [Neptunicella marina]